MNSSVHGTKNRKMIAHNVLNPKWVSATFLLIADHPILTYIDTRELPMLAPSMVITA